MNTIKITIFCLASFILLGCVLEEGISSVSTSTARQGDNKIITKVLTGDDGTITTIVTTQDPNGVIIKSTKTVTDASGNVISSDDPEAKAKAEASAVKKQKALAELKNAPKRSPNDPIKVALFQTISGEELKQVSVKGGIFPYIRKEFNNDPIIKLHDQNKVDSYHEERDFKTGKNKQFPGLGGDLEYLPVDVYVTSKALIKEEYGVSKSTNKLASAHFVFLEAIVHSEYSNQTWKVKEKGPIFQNAAVTKKFADKIRSTITKEIGPNIPADAWKYRRSKNVGDMDKEDAKEAIRSLFNK